MTLRRIGRIVSAGLLTLVAAAFLYFAGLVFATEVLPQIRQSGPSLTGSSMILNRTWHGNQLYLVVVLYLGVAGVALRGAIALVHRPRPAAEPA